MSHLHLPRQETGWGRAVSQAPETEKAQSSREASSWSLLKAGLMNSSQDQAFISLGSPPSLNHKSNENFQYVPLPCLINCSSCQSSALFGGSPESPLPALKAAVTPKVTPDKEGRPCGQFVCAGWFDHNSFVNIVLDFGRISSLPYALIYRPQMPHWLRLENHFECVWKEFFLLWMTLQLHSNMVTGLCEVGRYSDLRH